jgi:phenylacetate-CoA ligase
MAAQWTDPERLRELREQKLRRLVGESYKNVPYYRKLFDRAGVRPAEIKTLDDLRRIPVTTRAVQRELPAGEMIDRRIDPQSLRSEKSSGSTGTPFRVFYDQEFLELRNGLFLRGLRAVGYRPGQRLFLVTSRRNGSRQRRLLRWQYGSIEDSPPRLLRQFLDFKPHVLYGCVSPLILLAKGLERTKARRRPLKAVVTTAETLDGSTRALLRRVFRCPVYDFYGMTEMGLVAWECPESQDYHLSEDAVYVEPHPDDGGSSVARLVMTNLESRAMPFIRFETGDLGVLGRKEPCSCGRTLSLLSRVEGRLVDCVRLPGGRTVTPYALTCRLERIQGLRRYQVIQKSHNEFRVLVETADGNGNGRARDERIAEVMREALGKQAGVTVEPVRKIAQDPGRKFRVVESVPGRGGAR